MNLTRPLAAVILLGIVTPGTPAAPRGRGIDNPQAGVYFREAGEVSRSGGTITMGRG